ncbi:MAG: YciI family protein [Pseudonocardiaceae bacterium]
MNHYLYKLVPPRPTFFHDMTEAESTIMRDHVGYWTGLAHDGTAVVFGPVADPVGAWGLAVVEADTEHDVRALAAADPAITAELATFEVYPMPGAITRP